MIGATKSAIQFYIKCAWVRGKPTDEIIRSVYKTFGKNDEINRTALSCIALLHASTIYKYEEE